MDQNEQLQANLPKGFLSDPNSYIDSPEQQAQNAQKEQARTQLEEESKRLLRRSYVDS